MPASETEVFIHGIPARMLQKSSGPSTWPCFDDMGHTINPGTTLIQCVDCQGIVWQVQNGGPLALIEKAWDRRDRAIEFHFDRCPERKR